MVSGVFKDSKSVESKGMKDAIAENRLNSLPNRIKSAAIAAVYKTSENLWEAVFKECDSDNDGQITRRELLVLMKRLGLEIPPEGDLTAIIETYDVDENGLLDFDEFTVIMRALGVEMMVDQKNRGFRGAVQSLMKEKRTIVLWRDVYDKLDSFPRDGQIDVYELCQAFDQLDGPSLDVPKARRLMSKYDTDGDECLDFDEFKAMATDVISSAVQYERAQANCGNIADKMADANRRAKLANEYNKPLNASMLPAVEAKIQAAFNSKGTFDEASGVLLVQDELYRKFKIKYGAGQMLGIGNDRYTLDDEMTGERVLLLDAIIEGDLDTIRALMTIDWNFVYPPAYVDEKGKRQLEAWCRTPLCLLVRPDEGNFDSKLRSVSQAERLGLLEDVLSSGCADPNFPPIYWSTPAVHACFEGDVVALEALRAAGCNLRQKFEWVGQDEPLFSLVHAAAFNGQENVLRYLRGYFPPSFFQESDAAGNNGLHTLLESSRDIGTAKFLLEQDVDGFTFNQDRRSPLSMAIESLPELALLLLEKKSRFEYRWWGNDLFWFSFSGVILPLERKRPVQVRDQFGEMTTIEDLIIRNERKNLLETPIMLDVIDRKWKYFAQELYTIRIGKFALMLLSVFIASVSDPSTAQFYLADVAAIGSWVLNLDVKLAELKLQASSDRKVEFSPLAAIDYFHLVAVPILMTVRFGDAIDILTIPPGVGASLAFSIGLLQVTLALRLLSYVSLFRVLGPLIVTVLAMLYDALRFSGVLIIVTLGYANGFYSLIHSSTTMDELSKLDFDYSYTGIVSEMAIWLTGQASFDLIEPLKDVAGYEGVQLGVEILFWTFLASAYFVLLNLLIAIFNTTYERIISNSISEWLFVRLKTLLEFESDFENAGVQDYYEQLRSRDAQRAILKEPPQSLQG